MSDTVLRHGILESLARPLTELYEGWVDSTIDASKWTETDSASGPGWAISTSGAYRQIAESPNLNETARLVSDQLWIVAPDTFGTNTIIRRMCLEFEMKLANVANIDNAETFFGLTSTAADTRTSNNIVGWALTSDALQSVTDDGSTETTNTTFSETLTNWNKLKIVVSKGHARFYLNESEVANHITNLPDAPMYVDFYVDTEAGGAATVNLGIIRAWYEDFI